MVRLPVVSEALTRCRKRLEARVVPTIGCWAVNDKVFVRTGGLRRPERVRYQSAGKSAKDLITNDSCGREACDDLKGSIISQQVTSPIRLDGYRGAVMCSMPCWKQMGDDGVEVPPSKTQQVC